MPTNTRPTTLSQLPDLVDPLVVLADDIRSWHRALASYNCERHERVCVRWLHAFNAREGIDLLERRGEEIALVVSDHRMPPGMSGTEFLREVGQRWPNVRRMLLTSWLDGTKAAEAPYDTLSKDLDGAYLVDRICKLARDLP